MDHLRHLDYLCLALIEYSRQRFMHGDYVECLQIAMKPLDLESADEIIELAERLKRIMNPTLDKSSRSLPMAIEQEIEAFKAKSKKKALLQARRYHSQKMHNIIRQQCSNVREDIHEEDPSTT